MRFRLRLLRIALLETRLHCRALARLRSAPWCPSAKWSGCPALRRVRRRGQQLQPSVNRFHETVDEFRVLTPTALSISVSALCPPRLPHGQLEFSLPKKKNEKSDYGGGVRQKLPFIVNHSPPLKSSDKDSLWWMRRIASATSTADLTSNAMHAKRLR